VARVSTVAARIAGQVTRVAAADNQEVKVGDLLVELDDHGQQVKQAAARANLAASNASLAQAQARLGALCSRSARAGSAPCAAARPGLTGSAAQLDQARAEVALDQAKVMQAQAALDRATLELEYTKVHAELAGTVTQRAVEPGQLVSPDRALMAIVDLTDTWIVADLTEAQVADLKPGQPVDIELDSFGGPLRGHVDSIAAGTPSSSLPPDDATGTFIRVTQRVPVTIKVDDRRGQLLRPGMSAEVILHTH